MSDTKMRSEILKQLMKATGARDAGAIARVLDSFEVSGVITISEPKDGPWAAAVEDAQSKPKASSPPAGTSGLVGTTGTGSKDRMA